jgi:collagen type VII alpha
MKKMSFALSIVVLAAMLLAACGGGGANQSNQGTPGADVTMESTQAGAIPGTGTDMTSTPAAGTGTETGMGTGTATSTAGGTGIETGTATSTAGGTGTETGTATSTAGGTGMETGTATSTAGGTGSVTGTSTPSAGVPVTGAQHQFVLLSDVLKMNVNDNSGTQVGTVTGVVLNRPMGTTSSTGSTVSGASGASGASAGTATPTVGIGKGTLTTPTTSVGTSGSTGSTMAETGNNPRVAYVIVQTNNAGGSTSGTGTSSNNGTGNNSASGTATPTTGTSSSGNNSAVGSSSANAGEVLVPWEAFDFSNASASTGSVSALTLNSDVDASALAGAPAFDQTAVTGSAWDTDVTAYWSGKGLSVPVTGAETSMVEPVIVRGNFGSVNVVDASGKTVAQVRDLVIDATTGEVMYGIIGGGSLNSGSSLYVVPVDHLTWSAGQGQGQSANTLGDFNLKFDASQFNNAPTINSVSDLDLSSADWNSKYDTYWTGVSTNP